MILIVGGAGYIGSHVNKSLNSVGYQTVVLDNLSTGRKELVKWGKLIIGDVGDEKILDEIFTKYKIDVVVHLAGDKSVHESINDPEKYYLNNVANSLVLMKSMREHKINKLIYSSSCTTYGNVDSASIDESCPQNPLSPYGRSKLFVEEILKDYDHAYGMQTVCFRFFNAVGADFESEIGEWPHSNSYLMQILFDVALGYREFVKIFGTDYSTSDGTCVRDFVHVSDLADAHIKAVKYLENGGKTDFFNLGNGKGHSVREAISAVEKVTSVKIEKIEADRRSGDPVSLVAGYDKAERILGWRPAFTDFLEIVDSVFRWTIQCEKV